MVLMVTAVGPQEARNEAADAVKRAGLASSRAKAVPLLQAGARLGPLLTDAAGALAWDLELLGWSVREADPLPGGPEVGQVEALPPTPPPAREEVVKEEKRQLLRALTLEEACQCRDGLERAAVALAGLEEEKAAWVAEWKRRAAPHVAERDEMTRQLRYRERYDAVQVLHLLSADASTVRVVRTDTGEQLEERPATGDDLQQPLGGR